MMADIAPILARAGDNGGPFWSRADGDIHAPSGASTIDTMLVLGDLGATPVSYTHLTLPTTLCMCRSRWSPEQ